MEPDDAADIILELDQSEQDILLETLDKDDDIHQLLTYSEKEAGAYMTNRFVKVDIHQSIKEATRTLIRSADTIEYISTIFVVDEHNHYQGQIPLKKLIKANKAEELMPLIQQVPAFLDTDGIDLLMRHIHQYGSDALAIVNQHAELIGVITSDDLIDLYEEETLEDYERLAAVPGSDPEDHFFKKALKRLPWLLALLVLSIPIALITQAFESVIAGVVILAFFQPLILDAGGDVASQTLAVTLIGIKENNKGQLANGIKEIISGLISGTFLSVIAFLVTLAFAYLTKSSQPFELSLVVSLGLLVTVILGPIIGFIVPMTIKKLKFDPAIASGPFITTIVDMLSLFIYFGIAMLILGGGL